MSTESTIGRSFTVGDMASSYLLTDCAVLSVGRSRRPLSVDDVPLVDAMLQNFTFDDSLVFLESDVRSISPDTPRSDLSDISGMSATLH